MPFLSNDIVTTGPIARDGYVSQVTAGPRTGFGLMSSPNGIAFYNKQLASTVTPITDFQQQLAQEKKGKFISKLYQFGATSYDTPELTVYALINPSTGLSLSPAYIHSISAAFGATPIGWQRTRAGSAGHPRSRPAKDHQQGGRASLSEDRRRCGAGGQRRGRRAYSGGRSAGELAAEPGSGGQQHVRHPGFSGDRCGDVVAADERNGFGDDRPQVRADHHGGRPCPSQRNWPCRRRGSRST